MMKMLGITAATILVLALGGPALAQPAAAPAAPVAAATPAKKLTVDSTVKELLDDARAKAVLATHVPLIVEHAPEYPDIYPMTFRALAAMSEAQTMAGLTPEAFKTIESEINAL